MNAYLTLATISFTSVATGLLANPCFEHRDFSTGSTDYSHSFGHQDLGNGTVLSNHSGWDGHSNTSSSRFTMDFCETGQRVSIIYEGSCIGEDNPYCSVAGLTEAGSFEVDPDPIEEAILGMTRADQTYTFDQFASALARLGARLDGPTVSDYESCGCAVYYPELIGEKRPNRIREN